MNDRTSNPNSGGIKRGDGAETGDLEARPSDTVDRAGSGAQGGNAGSNSVVTADPSSGGLGQAANSPLLPDTELDDLTVKDANDPTLGLTNLDGKGGEDWAADTGETTDTEAEAPSTHY